MSPDQSPNSLPFHSTPLPLRAWVSSWFQLLLQPFRLSALRFAVLLSTALGLTASAQTTVSNTTYGTGQTATVVGPTTLATSGTVTVSSGANVTYQAATSIQLTPGTTLTAGSYFHALLNPASAQLPVITSAGTANGSVGAAFSYQASATNTPTSYSASGLPPGLSLNPATGLIIGTPTSAGTYQVALTASNAAGSYATTLSLSIGANPNADDDGDGISNSVEQQLGTNPNAAPAADSANATQVKITRPQ